MHGLYGASLESENNRFRERKNNWLRWWSYDGNGNPAGYALPLTPIQCNTCG